jgi:hypothetical protein
MTGNIWIDLQTSLAEIEAEIPDMSGELPRIPTVGNAMGQLGPKRAIDDALNLNRMSGTACLAVRAQSRRWPEAGSPMQVFISPDDIAAPVRVRP